MTDLYISITTDSDLIDIISPKSPCLEIISPKSPCLEITSPKNMCEVDGCYHTATDKLCKEHQMYTSLYYLVAHKPIQSPVAHSKYNFEHHGLSCIKIHSNEIQSNEIQSDE